MKKILFTAKDSNGKNQTDYIEAENNKNAINILKKKGYTQIKLHSEASIETISNKALDDIPRWQLKKMAKFELKIRKEQHSTISTLVQTIVINSWFILFGLIIALFGFIQDRRMTLYFGIFLMLITPTISLWRQRHVKRFNRIIEYFTFGQWDKALKEIKTHRKFKRFPELEHDLDFREATILAKKGNLEEGLSLVIKWQYSFEHSNPGYYESRLANIYLASGNHTKCYELTKIYHEKSFNKDFSAIDFAMVEAQYGDTDKALALIEPIDIESLPVIAHAYPNWIRGNIAKRNHDNLKAKHYLESALENILKKKGQALIEISIAECSAELAVIYHRLGKTKEALQLIQNVSTVLKAHGSKNLLDEVEKIVS